MNPFLVGRRPPSRVVVIGHRGCAHAPENTIEAFERGIARGAQMVEFDVRERLVISHDATKQRSPTLVDALHYFRLTGAFLNIEIKVAGIAREVVALVKKHRLVERTVISSFLHDQVALVKRLCHGIAGGVLCSDRIVDPSSYVRTTVGADIFSPSRHVFQPAKGVGVHVFTVNEPREMRRLVDAGATGIFTDYPERLIRVLSSPRT